jgi:hypothetical protein
MPIASRDQIRTYWDALGLDTDTLAPVEIPFLVLEQTASKLGGDYSAANVEAQAKTAFSSWGGEERFKACMNSLAK